MLDMLNEVKKINFKRRKVIPTNIFDDNGFFLTSNIDDDSYWRKGNETKISTSNASKLRLLESSIVQQGHSFKDPTFLYCMKLQLQVIVNPPWEFNNKWH